MSSSLRPPRTVARTKNCLRQNPPGFHLQALPDVDRSVASGISLPFTPIRFAHPQPPLEAPWAPSKPVRRALFLDEEIFPMEVDAPLGSKENPMVID